RLAPRGRRLAQPADLPPGDVSGGNRDARGPRTGGGPRMTRDPLLLPVLWQRLIAAVDEQATTLVRTAFTPVVAEAEDLAAGVFDARGRMLAQSLTGTPGHILSLATSVGKFMDAFADDLAPGDVL